jgi:hypothetical protein
MIGLVATAFQPPGTIASHSRVRASAARTNPPAAVGYGVAVQDAEWDHVLVGKHRVGRIGPIECDRVRGDSWIAGMCDNAIRRGDLVPEDGLPAAGAARSGILALGPE